MKRLIKLMNITQKTKIQMTKKIYEQFSISLTIMEI